PFPDYPAGGRPAPASACRRRHQPQRPAHRPAGRSPHPRGEWLPWLKLGLGHQPVNRKELALNTISLMTANYVAREVGYQMTRGWGQGDKATNEAFRPIEQFGPRFETILQEARDMGFKAIDLWLAHLSPNWATDEHISTARRLLDQYELSVVSLAGWFGSSPEEFEKTCQMALQFGSPVLGGGTSML